MSLSEERRKSLAAHADEMAAHGWPDDAEAIRILLAHTESAAPVDMVLFCPKCGLQHIDGPEWADDPHDIEQGQMRVWNNPPHRSHLCHHCGFIWRPADVPTNGVASIKTCGKNDSPAPAPSPVSTESAAPVYAYEWDCGPGVVHRDFEYCSYNGRYPDRTLTLYAAPPAPPPVSGADERAAFYRKALYQIAYWPDGGNNSGQSKIQQFAIKALDGEPCNSTPTPTGQHALSDAAAQTRYQELIGVGYVVLGHLVANGIDIPERFLDAFSDPDSIENPLELLPYEFSPSQSDAAAPQAVALTEKQRDALQAACVWVAADTIAGKTIREWLDRESSSAVAATPAPAPAPATADALTDAARDVLAERRRQVEQEGWTPEHDDSVNDVCALADAATCYAMHAAQMLAGAYKEPVKTPKTLWPWDAEWWKPTTPRRDLVKAGALILAEIERLDRAALSKPE